MVNKRSIIRAHPRDPRLDSSKMALKKCQRVRDDSKRRRDAETPRRLVSGGRQALAAHLGFHRNGAAPFGGLETSEHPMMLAELRDGGVFLQPAAAMPVRDIPLEQMEQWIAEDEEGAEAFWDKAR